MLDQKMHSAVLNVLNLAKMASIVKHCNENGVGRMPQFRTLNLKISQWIFSLGGGGGGGFFLGVRILEECLTIQN